MSDFIDSDDDMIDSDALEDKRSFKAFFIGEDTNLLMGFLRLKTIIHHFELIQIPHEDLPKIEFDDADLILFHCRVIQCMQDIDSISTIKQVKPLVPVMAFSDNKDEQFVTMLYENGVMDVLELAVPPVHLEKKILAIFDLIEANSLLEIKNIEAIDTARELRDKVNELNQEKISRLVAETERDMVEEVARLLNQNKEILDNLKEGFFVVLPDLTIDKVTSNACLDLFSNEIAGMPLGSILNLKDNKESYVKLNMQQVFENMMPLEISVDMLPKQATTVSDRVLSFDYEAILEEDEVKKVIVITTDITQQIIDKEKSDARDKKNTCLINILKNRESFRDFVSDFRRSLESLPKAASMKEVNRIFHTLKGNSASYSLDDISHLVHNIESSLKYQDYIDRSLVKSHAKKVAEAMKGFLDDNFEVLKIKFEVEGEKTYPVSAKVLEDLQEIAEVSDQKTASDLKSLIQLIKGVDLRQLIKVWESNVARLALKLDKDIRLVFHEKDIEHFDFEKFSPLLTTLVHPITNACDHGIEAKEERVEAGKPQQGTLNISISEDNEATMIKIEDDGKGINLSKIVGKALENGLINEKQAQEMSEQEKYHLIFHDGLSTNETVSETSGRGVGMSAVRMEVENLGGRIRIESEEGKGSVLEISIPKSLGFGQVEKDQIEVLVCDDEPDIIEAMQQIFEMEDIASEAVTDGLEGVLRLTMKRYNFIILDLELPGMNGKTILKKIRHENIGGNKSTPVVILSGFIDNEFKEFAAHMQDVYFVGKPFDPTTLTDLILEVSGVAAA